MTAIRTLPASVSEATLYVAFELGAKSWKLGVTAGFGIEPWVQTVVARDWAAVRRVLQRARTRFGLAPTAGVMSCYEAGRDGFWIHRALEAQGLANRVVDSASIEVDPRSRRTKTDRIDARKLVQMLVRACLGDTHVWREVHVPLAAAEAARHVSRERSALVAEQTRLTNQVQSVLTTYGTGLPKRRTGGWWTTDGAGLVGRRVAGGGAGPAGAARGAPGVCRAPGDGDRSGAAAATRGGPARGGAAAAGAPERDCDDQRVGVAR